MPADPFLHGMAFMKFSLKSWLISMCVLGAVVGVMARLLMENPEMFLTVVRIGSTVGPFVLATATIVWLGLRGTPRGRGLVMWGCTLFLTPILVHIALALLLPSGNPLQVLTTQRLISKRLTAQIEEPWVWRELERRLVNGDLTKAEVDSAVEELTAHMKRTKPAGWNQPLSWQNNFLKSAIQKRMISQSVFIGLCEAFFGPSPTVKVMSASLSEDDTRFTLSVEYGSNWSDHSGLDVQLIGDINQVLLDDKPVKLHDVQKYFGRQASMTVEADLTPGEHKLAVELECAFVDTSRLAGANLNTLQVDQWPKARKRWTTTQTIPMQVSPSAE
jgi:hypothetical protein